MTKETRILLVEDDPGDALLVKHALIEAGMPFDLVHVERLADAIARLAKGGFHAVLLDLSLPDSSGLDTVRELYRVAPGVPIVVLTGLSDESAELGAVEAGAQDYLRKGLIGDGLLVRVIRYAIERKQQQERAALLIKEQAARAAAEEALRARDEFLSIAAHELYTPLTSLQLAIQTMLMSLQKGEARDTAWLAKRLKMAERQGKRLAKLIEELLDVSRIHAGRLDLSLEEVDLVATVTHVLEDLEQELASAGCAVSIHAEGAAIGRWDALRIEQVVTNLVSNAIKYGAGKPIDIAITRRPGGRVRLEVEDHGIGIAPEMQARIFDRFERAVPRRNYGGLGLGLYIVRRVAEEHGGSVDVASVPGQGARFSVDLPLAGPRTIGATSAASANAGDAGPAAVRASN